MFALICVMIFLSGFATLSWEVLWQIKSGLALGVSAHGAAISLAVMMGGMSSGSLLMGYALRRVSSAHALRIYGLLECIVGLAGLLLNVAFALLEKLDTWTAGLLLLYPIGIVAVLGLPSLCMGASLPVFSVIAKRFNLSIASLYGLNTAGAALGVLCVAFIMIPSAGISATIGMIAAMNISVAMMAWLIPISGTTATASVPEQKSLPVSFRDILLISATGFATFTLEIAWFRALASTFANTTDMFAIMLASVLIALWQGGRKAAVMKQKQTSPGKQLIFAGILILLLTPLIERLDLPFIYLAHASSGTAGISPSGLLHANTFAINGTGTFLYIMQAIVIFILVSMIIVPPLRYLGIALPWMLEQRAPHKTGLLYAVNTLAAMLGSLASAWFLLPAIGFAKTAALAGALVMLAGLLCFSATTDLLWLAPGMAAFYIAIYFTDGIGVRRVQGYFANLQGKPARILDYDEGPQDSISVVEYDDGGRALLINSATAAGEPGRVSKPAMHYMAWMGHLPMLLHSDPVRALVICFGTGQTANALRKENPKMIEVVDINAHIYQMAHYFKSNEQVLNDSRVRTITMDGRAYLRRTRTLYDVITLEPMPPVMSGVNAFYSREFYELTKTKLTSRGVIAQWLPFHNVAPHYAASIVKTFIAVYPNALLWIDPVSKNGVLLGTKDNERALGSIWPGFDRNPLVRNLRQDEVVNNIALDAEALQRYAAYGEMISDDNQLLAYGNALYAYAGFVKENFDLLRRITGIKIY